MPIANAGATRQGSRLIREDRRMTRNHWILLVVGLVAGLLISGRYALLAQDRGGTAPPNSSRSSRGSSTDGPKNDGSIAEPKAGADPIVADDRPVAQLGPKGSASVGTLQDALLRPYRFPFSRPTPLNQVCAHLQQTLKAPVVLDLAALDRQTVEPEDPVQLELDGVRLKTGLKLLLDQVGLTFHIVAEDNLLIITDKEGSEDPADRIWSELHALHRDLHDLQDAVDELRTLVGGEKGEGPRVHKPTIIEEMPEDVGAKPGVIPEKPGRGVEKPQGPAGATPGTRPGTSRVPLSGRPRTS
jgi:hypothetical protein